MKKVTLLIALMMIIAFTVYAEITVTVTGKSELTFGVSLDDPLATGFTNTNESKIDFNIVKDTSTKGAEEDVYGWIELKDWKANLVVDKDVATWAFDSGDVTAKIIFPNGWVKISGTNNEIGYVNIVQDDDGDNDNADAGLKNTLATSGGAVLGLNFAPIAVEVGLFSELDWTADNNYGASVKVTLDVAPIKVEAGVLMGLNHTDTDFGVGGKVTATIAPITAYVGADAEVGATITTYELGGGLSLTAAGLTLTGDVSYNNNTATPTASVDGLDTRIKLDAGGVVPNLGAAVTVELFNILGAVGADSDADMEYAVIVALSYTTPKIKPYANVRYGTYTHNDDTDTYTYLAAAQEQFKLNLGAELYLITNVTFIVDYNSDDLSSATKSNGIIKFITKISY